MGKTSQASAGVTLLNILVNENDHVGVLQAVFKIEALVSFILKRSEISALQLKDLFKSKTSIQEYRNEIQNSN